MVTREEFGREAVNYLRSYLDSNVRVGKRLGRLLARHNLEAGTAWAFLPAEISPDQRSSFTRGGLYPLQEGAPFGEGRLYLVSDPSLEAEATAWVEALLTEPTESSRLLCVEEPYERPADRHADEQPDRRVFYCGDDVYHYALPDTPVEEALRRARGATWEPSIGMVTTLPGGLSTVTNGQSVSPEAMDEMAAAALAIIIGAWDLEALLFWEPPERSAGVSSSSSAWSDESRT